MRGRKRWIENFILVLTFLICLMAVLLNIKCKIVFATDIGETVYANETSYVNTGAVSASEIKGDNENAEAYGVYVENATTPLELFKNTETGSISAVAQIGNATSQNHIESNAFGVYYYFEKDVRARNTKQFLNLGKISATVTAGDTLFEGSVVVSYSVGVHFGANYGKVENFTNKGMILAKAMVGDDSSRDSSVYSYASGVDVYASGNFTNLGTVSAVATAGNAWAGKKPGYPYGSRSVSAKAKGFDIEELDGGASNFVNSGMISASVKVGDALGEDLWVDIDDSQGVYIVGHVGNFTNTGIISINAEGGSAFGANSNVIIGDNYPGITGVYVDSGSISNFVNSGKIYASVKAGSNSTITNVAGVKVRRNSYANVVNSGEIYVKVDAPQAKSVNRVAGIFVGENSDNVTISNPGAIYLWNNYPNADIRTLRIESSNVTLSDKFSIVFGSPGIDPSPNATTNLNFRPVYVGSGSTLNLNGADLLARIDSRNLKFNIPYYIIQKESSGNVNGVFGNLVKAFSNPEVTVSWVDPNDRGANAAVEFGYVPGQNSLAGAMGGTSSWIISSMIGHMIGSYLPWTSPFFFTKEKEKVMLASAAVTPVITSPGYKGGFFVMPFYTRMNADDLNFDANAYGFVLGLGGKILPDLSATIYGGYSYVDLDFDVKGPQGEDQDLWIGGIILNYFKKPWNVRLSGTIHSADHDYEGRTGANYEFKEKADYDSWGIDTELTVGYLFERDRLSVLPEIGLGYTYYDTDNFHTKVSANPAWNRYYRPDSVDFFKAIVGVTGFYRYGEDKAILTGSVRLEQSLGENDVSVISYLLGLPRYKLEQDISDTTVIGQLGLSLKLKKNAYFDLNVRGDFNADYQAYTGKAMLRINF